MGKLKLTVSPSLYVQTDPGGTVIVTSVPAFSLGSVSDTFSFVSFVFGPDVTTPLVIIVPFSVIS